MQHNENNIKIRRIDATDERQYMLDDKYEIYEKLGAPIGALSFHYHNFYEIIYVLEGEYSSMIEEQTYHLKKGDFLLIDCNVMHKYHFIEKKHDSSKRIILWITKEMLNHLSDGEMDFTACFQKNQSCAYHFPVYYEELMRGFLQKLVMAEMLSMNLATGKKVLDKGYLTLFFVYLNALCARKEYFFHGVDMVEHPLVAEVSSYIEAHIAENIWIDELAEMVHMSKYHFLRKFKTLTGMTVHAFLTNKRLIKACEALKNGVSITEAYERAGFQDYSSFLRNFKKAYGISPGKYKDYY
ncbi:AraC family transcriptional regulator [Lachnospiraceae bacterium OttesenSCG-928-D06]|nr:AraC family transcriptional regulator [Lachnospiraceae bacterium OttesenSCG-928-D06]